MKDLRERNWRQEIFGDNKLGKGVSTVKILERNIDGVRPESRDICLRQLTIRGIVFSFDRILRLGKL